MPRRKSEIERERPGIPQSIVEMLSLYVCKSLVDCVIVLVFVLVFLFLFVFVFVMMLILPCCCSWFLCCSLLVVDYLIDSFSLIRGYRFVEICLYTCVILDIIVLSFLIWFVYVVVLIVNCGVEYEEDLLTINRITFFIAINTVCTCTYLIAAIGTKSIPTMSQR